MNQILELMDRVPALIYEVNQLMKQVDTNLYSSFLEAAESGESIDEYEIEKEEHIELFNKRKEVFTLNNKIIGLIQDLSIEDRYELASKVEERINQNIALYYSSFNDYQIIIDKITSPEFSFESNPEYKETLVLLKEQYSKYQTAVDYFNNMYAYLRPFKRSK